MIRIRKEKALWLHQLVTKETGGSPDVRDLGLLESALESAFQTYGGEELYPTTVEKAARLGFSLIANHAFLDGNKRIGILVMLTFLQVNGVSLDIDNDDVARIGLAVAAGEMSYEHLLAWLRAHQC